MRTRKEENFVSCFDEKTGRYFRTGIIEDGRDTGKDPFMASFPELLDVGIMGHCIHGKSGLCVKAGVECYQDGLHSEKENMSLTDFKSIVRQCKKNTYQIALGGCGDPDQHENFEEILKICRENGIVPNFTTSGLGMTEEKAKICKKYCGAVAVSWYRSDYTIKAIKTLQQAGVKTNIHYVLSNSTLDEALERMKNSSIVYKQRGFGDCCQYRENGFSPKINAVVFLLHKPVGLGTEEEVIKKDNSKFWELLDYIDQHTFPFKVGFDSCTVPSLLSLKNINRDSVDTCEGGRWSAYISADMKMMPCSFDNQEEKWAVSLREHSIKEAWNSDAFENFRTHFKFSCPTCNKRELCMGGCPIVPEIVLCKEGQDIPGICIPWIQKKDYAKLKEKKEELQYEAKEKMLDEMLEDARHSMTARNYLVKYLGRVMVATYYVQNFYYPEPAEKWDSPEPENESYHYYVLHRMGESELATLKCLYDYYFVPRAEASCDCSIMMTVTDEKLKWEEKIFQVEKVFELAKIYMAQRFYIAKDRVFCRDGFNPYYEKSKEVLEDLWWEMKVSRAGIAFEKQTRNHEPPILRYFKLDDYARRVLNAYEMRLNGKGYADVVAETGLSKNCIRILDFFPME